MKLIKITWFATVTLPAILLLAIPLSAQYAEDFSNAANNDTSCTSASSKGNGRTSPLPDIKANGQDGQIYLSFGQPLTVDLSLDPGDEAGNDADWWLVLQSPSGWYYYHVRDNEWKSGFRVTYQGPLVHIGPYTLLNGAILPIGTYTFYFGVDMDMNGSLDMDQIYYDLVTVTVI